MLVYMVDIKFNNSGDSFQDYFLLLFPVIRRAVATSPEFSGMTSSHSSLIPMQG